MKKSMSLLRQALKRNPLDYQARYYLAKAYLQFSAVDGDYFDMAVRELKRAALIRGSNKQIALDCGQGIFFSLWPLLEEEDKTFATDASGQRHAGALLAGIQSAAGDVVALCPGFVPAHGTAASASPNSSTWPPTSWWPPPSPWSSAANFSPCMKSIPLTPWNDVTTNWACRGRSDLDDARSLLNQLRRLKGYYRLQTGSGFAPEKLARLQRELLLRVISGLLGDAKAARLIPNQCRRVREYIQKYIADHSGLNDLDDLQKLLEEKNYFKDNDFPSLYLKTLITYKKGSYGDIIAEIEALRQTISFVKKEQLADYTNILLLLIDSYYSTKLMTAAEKVAKELYESQPDNSDVLFRVLRIRNILGVEGAPDPILDAKLETVDNSRFLILNKTNSSHDVFLFNAPEIEIVLDPSLLAQLKPKQLVQVFVEGRIAFENYVDGLPEKIVIGPPFTGIERKVKVQVTYFE